MLAPAFVLPAAAAMPPPQPPHCPTTHRCFNDKSFVRWPPHVNLLYPFLESQHFPVAAQAAAEALRPFKPFQARRGKGSGAAVLIVACPAIHMMARTLPSAGDAG